mgnify:CR=1 FL=1
MTAGTINDKKPNTTKTTTAAQAPPAASPERSPGRMKAAVPTAKRPMPTQPSNTTSPAPAKPVQDEKLLAARAKNLDQAISQIQKDYGEGAIMRL